MVGDQTDLIKIVEALDEGVVVLDASGMVIFANPAAHRLLDVGESLVGSDFGPLVTDAETGRPYTRRISGTALAVTSTSISWGGRPSTLAVLHPWPEPEVVRWKREAESDPLTGLLNRRGMVRALEEAEVKSVLVIDLDGFKAVNDTYGHATGDAVLVAVARRLRSAVRPDDVVARFGGDEFAVLLADEVDPWEVRIVAGRIASVLETTIRIDGHELRMKASVGAAIPVPGAPAHEALQAADEAMYQAKRLGGGIWLATETTDEARWDLVRGHLMRRLGAGYPTVAYEPIARPDGSVAGVETLLRWKTGRRRRPDGTESPGFVGWEGIAAVLPSPAAVEEVARMGRRIIGGGLPGLGPLLGSGWVLALDVTPADLMTDVLADELAGVQRRAGGSAAIRLEVASSGWAMDPTVERITALRQAGTEVWIDGFGLSGPLILPTALPAEGVKLAAELISQLHGSGSARDLLRAIVEEAIEVGWEVGAEGVTDHDTARILVEAGCTQLQGPHIAPALEPVDLVSFLRQTRPLP